ncbi:MAG: hypothetical protein DRH08_03625 [Deltaproteobacteria bacterium]|nr:MAG: hypothetical protein DRH08_03625 [Deltaproteobacteria bacterium]
MVTANSEQKRKVVVCNQQCPRNRCNLSFLKKDRATRDSFYRESRIKRNSVREGNLRSITRGDILNDYLAGQGWNTLAGCHLNVLMIHRLRDEVK